MTAFGFGEVVGGFLHGIVIDRIGSKRSVFVNMLFLIVVLITTQSTLHINEYNWVTILACFFWGYEDGMNNIYHM